MPAAAWAVCGQVLPDFKEQLILLPKAQKMIGSSQQDHYEQHKSNYREEENFTAKPRTTRENVSVWIHRTSHTCVLGEIFVLGVGTGFFCLSSVVVVFLLMFVGDR